MDDTSVPPPSSEPRPDSERSATPSPPRASTFTAINTDNAGEPRRLRHVSRGVMQQQVDDGIRGEDGGPERGFQGQPHGTDFRDPPVQGKWPSPLSLDLDLS